MENNAKAIEYINYHVMADYMQKLVNIKMGKLILFSIFPITGAPNISDPHYYVKILNPEILSDLIFNSRN